MTYFISIFLATFFLEDVALVSSVVLLSINKITFLNAFLACFLGISFGDLALYLIGHILSRYKIKENNKLLKKYLLILSKFKKSDILTYSIVLARFIPGTRLPTYVATGLLNYPFLKFLMLTLFTVFLWVYGNLKGGSIIYNLFNKHWFFSLIVFFTVMHSIKNMIQILCNKWRRKSFFYSLKKYKYFEFWPAQIFYIPVVFYYIFLSFKYMNFFLPFYVNPNLRNGGLIGESKWDFLKYLDKNEPFTLQTARILYNNKTEDLNEILTTENMFYPIILKPDVGQRGFGVRIARSNKDVMDYLEVSNFDILIQKLSLLEHEAGIFYIRKPSEEKGKIFSITDKVFPFIIGDGRTKIGDLILKDNRAKLIASTYFVRFKEKLDLVPHEGEIIPLSECGNHCQGCIFKNGSYLLTNELTDVIDKIAKQIPDFYFGRFDLRYQDSETLKQGKCFEIVEVNGAGAEATHIWDRETKLLEAYRVLFKQWSLLFEIGQEARKTIKNRRIKFFQFIIDCIKFIFRNKNLSISS